VTLQWGGGGRRKCYEESNKIKIGINDVNGRIADILFNGKRMFYEGIQNVLYDILSYRLGIRTVEHALPTWQAQHAVQRDGNGYEYA
jgi:hypothetical protein